MTTKMAAALRQNDCSSREKFIKLADINSTFLKLESHQYFVHFRQSLVKQTFWKDYLLKNKSGFWKEIV